MDNYRRTINVDFAVNFHLNQQQILSIIEYDFILIEIRGFKCCKLFDNALFFYNKLRPSCIIPDKHS